MEQLQRLVGRELAATEMSRRLADWASARGCGVIGALHVTCADETEREAAEAFQKGFVDYLVPRLGLGQHAPFRLANLGARYEPGALAVAESHFAGASQGDGSTLLVIKLNSHVAVVDGPDGPQFGPMQRYGAPSEACGALHALLDGRDDLPALAELRSTFASGGVDRLAALADPGRVRPALRYLLAAVCNALLQAKRVREEARAHRERGTTDFLILAAVTLNRAPRDTEILCGCHLLTRESEAAQHEFHGLGDDPATLGMSLDRGSIKLFQVDTGSSHT